MRRTLIGLILTILITSCGQLPVAKRFQKDFTNCYGSGTLGNESSLRFDGYYQFKHINDKDTFDLNIFFYPDGTYLDNVIFPDYFPYCGIYRVKNDTVIAQYMNITYGAAPRILREYWYKIITPDTLKLIYTTNLGDEISNTHLFYTSVAVRRDTSGRFMRSDNIPGPDSWLKKENWTNCDERVKKGYPFNLREDLHDQEYSGHNGSYKAYVKIQGSKAYADIIYMDETPHFRIFDTINLSSFQSTSILGKKTVLFKRKNKLFIANRGTNEKNAVVIPLKPEENSNQLSEVQMQEINISDGEYADKRYFLVSGQSFFNVSIHSDTAIINCYSRPRYAPRLLYSDTLFKTADKPALFLSELHIIYYNKGRYYLETREGVMPFSGVQLKKNS
ncbi:MAG: hypothetical protein ACM3RX_04135 [Methanococcaceae archaeon]